MEQSAIETLPHSQEAERSVLGAMLLDVGALDSMLEQLKPDDFYQDAHQCIFEAMRNIRQAGNAVDVITLSTALLSGLTALSSAMKLPS